MADQWTSLLVPPAASAAAPPPTFDLTAEQLRKLDKFDEHFNKPDLELPVKEHSEEKAGLSEREMMFLSRETFIRFLLATKGDVAAALKRLEECIVWRRTERLEDVEWMAEDCSPESATGKNFVLGYSPKRQPIIYFFPNRNTTPVEERRAVHVIFLLERARDLMVDGVTNVVVVFNFAGKRSGPPTSISVAREVLHILSHYYPETLRRNIFQNTPWIVRTFITILWPFVDPVTRQKFTTHNAEDRLIIKDGYVRADQLLTECGGDLDLPYDHEKYWPAMLRVCLAEREKQITLWRKGEKRAGREEREWKRSSSEGLEPVPAAPQSSNMTTAPVAVEEDIEVATDAPAEGAVLMNEKLDVAEGGNANSAPVGVTA